jgi:hypothetical protein
MKTYLAIDNETGGFDGTSLLTSYLAVLDEKLDVVADHQFVLKPNNGIYLVEAGGLAVNGINLVEHDRTAVTYSMAGQALRNFLIRETDSGKNKLIPFGHGVIFDVLSIHAHLLGRATFEQYTSYRKFDTAVVAQFLKFANLLPQEVSGSLGSLAEYFHIVPTKLHDAKSDVETTIAVAKAMGALVGWGGTL